MEREQAIKILEDLRRNDPVVQRGRNGELTAAFKAFWDSCPDEPTFSRHTGGLLITPTLLYYMVEHPIWMRKNKVPEEPPKDPATPAEMASIPVPIPPKGKGAKHGNR